jgi:hypothetical protein
MLHTHISSGAGTVGQLVVIVPSGLSLTPPHETKKKYPDQFQMYCQNSQYLNRKLKWSYLHPEQFQRHKHSFRLVHTTKTQKVTENFATYSSTNKAVNGDNRLSSFAVRHLFCTENFQWIIVLLKCKNISIASSRPISSWGRSSARPTLVLHYLFNETWNKIVPVLKTEINGRGYPLRWPRDTLYTQKLALASLTSGDRSVGIVRLRTTSHGVFFLGTKSFTLVREWKSRVINMVLNTV